MYIKNQRSHSRSLDSARSAHGGLRKARLPLARQIIGRVQVTQKTTMTARGADQRPANQTSAAGETDQRSARSDICRCSGLAQLLRTERVHIAPRAHLAAANPLRDPQQPDQEYHRQGTNRQIHRGTHSKGRLVHQEGDQDGRQIHKEKHGHGGLSHECEVEAAAEPGFQHTEKAADGGCRGQQLEGLLKFTSIKQAAPKHLTICSHAAGLRCELTSLRSMHESQGRSMRSNRQYAGQCICTCHEQGQPHE
mmetsp:Transcript_15748/g.43541  ORF Transcript_15748/g.43541 Transcript_15748/m.43541 type:complete len:251 (+) Transcript_15748:73-825(+)